MLQRVLEVTTSCPRTCSVPRALLQQWSACIKIAYTARLMRILKSPCARIVMDGVVQTSTQIVITWRQIGWTSSPRWTDLLAHQNVAHDYYCRQNPVSSLHTFKHCYENLHIIPFFYVIVCENKTFQLHNVTALHPLAWNYAYMRACVC
jgi:hypothetical protein